MAQGTLGRQIVLQRSIVEPVSLHVASHGRVGLDGEEVEGAGSAGAGAGPSEEDVAE